MKAQLVGVLFLWLLVSTAAATAGSELPEGKGKDAVENTCTDCHSVERIKTQHLNEEGWNNIVREMIENGASINSDDVKVIVDYLTKNFGPDKKVKPERTGKGERPRG